MKHNREALAQLKAQYSKTIPELAALISVKPGTVASWLTRRSGKDISNNALRLLEFLLEKETR